jgi:Holliday junction DNA helicase RuvB
MVGQRSVVESVRTAIAAARVRGEPVDHQLLTGPPGLGKTTMARAIAAEMGVRLHDTTGSCLRTADDLVQLLLGLGEGDIVFIDEIHGLDPRVTEIVHRALEDRQVSVVLRSGTLCRAVTLDLPPFTLIGATTEPGQLTPAFLGRFVDQHLLEYYPPAEMTEILGRAAPHFGLELDALAAARLALVSRTLERDHEPYLLRLGLMDVTPNGRTAPAGAGQGSAYLRLVRDPERCEP